MPTSKTNPFRQTFVAIVLTNAIIGISDLAAGMFFLFLPQILDLVIGYADTRLGGALLRALPAIQDVGAFYFFSHGVVKLFLAWALLKDKLWAYPLAIIFFTVFSVSQIGSLIIGFSKGTLVLLLLNLSVLAMVIREYWRVKREKLTAHQEDYSDQSTADSSS